MHTSGRAIGPTRFPPVAAQTGFTMTTERLPLSDSQIAVLFDEARLVIPDVLRAPIWTEVRRLKDAAARLRCGEKDVLAAKVGAL